ncbi:MAG: cysteine desulfurase [Planctomycetes bacterium]|nr:cysteine desulfurase [Planctomycetota bacterium]
MKTIYLDYNATTPIAPDVQTAMLPFLAEHYGNPSSGHALGRACHEATLDARAKLAALLGAERDEIIFTGCGTESNNLVLKGLAFRQAPLGSGHFVISSIEHPAVTEPARFLERLGFGLTIVDCDARGRIDPDDVAAAIQDDTLLVSIMLANNEIGTIQPIAEISKICRQRGVLLHTDAAQAVGKIPTRVDDLGVDFLSIAGHKLYAPKGIGALYVRRGTALEPLLHGAGHEGGLRAGTENVPYMVALGKAAELAGQHLSESVERLAMLRDRLQQALVDACGPKCTVNGAGAERLPNTLSINIPNVDASELLARIPELCASTSAACHTGQAQRSATQQAIALPEDVARGTIRLSVGWFTDEEEVDRAANLLIGARQQLR